MIISHDLLLGIRIMRKKVRVENSCINTKQQPVKLLTKYILTPDHKNDIIVM